MPENGQEPVEYTVVEVTLQIRRQGWETLERWAAIHDMTPVQSIEQLIEARIQLMDWMITHHRAIS